MITISCLYFWNPSMLVIQLMYRHSTPIHFQVVVVHQIIVHICKGTQLFLDHTSTNASVHAWWASPLIADNVFCYICMVQCMNHCGVCVVLYWGMNLRGLPYWQSTDDSPFKIVEFNLVHPEAGCHPCFFKHVPILFGCLGLASTLV